MKKSWCFQRINLSDRTISMLLALLFLRIKGRLFDPQINVILFWNGYIHIAYLNLVRSSSLTAIQQRTLIFRNYIELNKF